jgi:hypothetical protein
VGIGVTNYFEILSRNVGLVMPLMALKMMCSVKKVKLRTITRAIVVMKILWDSMTNINFILHCHVVFELQI